MKAIIALFQIAAFFWQRVRPIFHDIVHIIDEVKQSGLSNDEARKKVFQDVTDFIQARGMEKVPDSVLNCSIELAYQIYLWDRKKGGVQNV